MAHKVLRGGSALGVASVAEQTVRFARNVVLARVLAPDAFGAMALVLSANAIVATLMDAGAKESLIRNPRAHDPKYLQATWVLAMLRGLALYALVFVAAPWLGAFYDDTRLVSLLRVVALGALVDGAVSPRAYLAIKDLKLWRWALVSNCGGIAGVLITIGMALYWQSVWALATGFVCESVAKCVMSFIVCPFLPRLRWHRNETRDLFAFSRGLFGLSFLNLAYSRLDVFTLGKLVAPSVVGTYTLAVYLIQTPITFLLSLMSSTLLPAFSEAASDSERLARMHLRTVGLLLAIGFPTAAFVVCCGEAVLEFTYGPIYRSAAPAFQLAAVVSVFYVLNGEITLVFYAQGRPELHRTGVALAAGSMAALVYPAIVFFGPNAAQAAALASILTGYSYQVMKLQRLLPISWSTLWKIHLIPSAAALAVLVVFTAGTAVFDASAPLPTLCTAVVSATVGYGVAGLLLYRTRQVFAFA